MMALRHSLLTFDDDNNMDFSLFFSLCGLDYGTIQPRWSSTNINRADNVSPLEMYCNEQQDRFIRS